MDEHFLDFSKKDKVQEYLLEELIKERVRQDAKFGNMPRSLKTEVWLTILMEEVGEVARAILEGKEEDYTKELVQVAAVAIATCEDFYLSASLGDMDNKTCTN